MALSTGKIAEVMFEKYKETYDHQDSMLSLVTKNEPDSGMLQNAGNVICRVSCEHLHVLILFSFFGRNLQHFMSSITIMLTWNLVEILIISHDGILFTYRFTI